MFISVKTRINAGIRDKHLLSSMFQSLAALDQIG